MTWTFHCCAGVTPDFYESGQGYRVLCAPGGWRKAVLLRSDGEPLNLGLFRTVHAAFDAAEGHRRARATAPVTLIPN